MGLNQILGVAVSTLPGVVVGVLVGVILDRYRTWIADKTEKQQWYASMRMLAKQAKQITDEADVSQDYLISTYESIASDLRQYNLNAPIYDEAVSGASIELAQDCLKARDKAARIQSSTDFRDKIGDATEFQEVLKSSQQLDAKAESSIKRL